MTSAATAITIADIPSTKPRSLWGDAFIRLKKNKLAIVCFVIINLYALTALLAWLGLLATDYGTTTPESYGAPSSNHWFGTDIFGRDVFQRTIHGTRIALSIGLVTSLIAIPIGVVLGALAGYFGGIIDDFIVWFYTTMDSIPDLLKIIALSFVLGRGLMSVYVAIGFTTWVGLCRLIRGEFIKHKNRDYVHAAQALGASHMRRMFIHILPNVFHIILINFSLRFIVGIKTEVVLSYLGLGVEPGNPSWGVMIDDAKLELARGVWWQLAAATFAMFFLVLAFNIFTDSLREALDPKLRNK
ncbi:MAG: ABC transporter permease [Oligoflexia bacterium]|nr:ABC transporter permease [Oligoflexia bacterium]